MISATAGLAVGLLLGARHALDPDHLAAISTVVAEERAAARAARAGALWGLGHTLALLVFGLALAAARVQLPPAVAELFVVAMPVALGVRALVRAPRAHTHP